MVGLLPSNTHFLTQPSSFMPMDATPAPLLSICTEVHACLRDTPHLVRILAGIRQSDCRKLREAYSQMYGEDLLQLFQGLGLTCLSGLMFRPSERDAAAAREAIRRSDDTGYDALVEIFACRKSSHVLLILQTYYTKFKSSLEADIARIEPPHPYQKILTALSASHKALQADDTSPHIAKCDARRLYQTGEGQPRAAVDEAVILEIFCKRSISQLRLTFRNYKHIYGHSYTSFLRNSGFGDFEDALRVVVECINNPPRYFAKILHGCLNSETIARQDLVLRIMVSRAEVDMNEIQNILRKKYCIELKHAIHESLPEGCCRDLLVALAANNSSCC